jgi:ATP-dependent DNA helicase RecQ
VRISQFLITSSQEEGGKAGEALVAHNLELLKRMTFYATGTGCLRSRLLRYFGEDAPPYCGNCSNCNTLFESADISLEARKIISCVLRLKQRGRNFGKTMIIDILRGGKNEKIGAAGLDSLSTYGIMAGVEARRIRAVMDYLIQKDYLVLEGDEYPVVKEGRRWQEIIIDKQPLSMMLAKESPGRRNELSSAPQGAPPGAAGKPEPRAGKPEPEQSEKTGHAEKPAPPLLSESDEALMTKLKELRKTLAREAAVPAYIIFSDASLRDMCLKKPPALSAFENINGVGKVKLLRYGEAFTALIRDHLES